MDRGLSNNGRACLGQASLAGGYCKLTPLTAPEGGLCMFNAQCGAGDYCGATLSCVRRVAGRSVQQDLGVLHGTMTVIWTQQVEGHRTWKIMLWQQQRQLTQCVNQERGHVRVTICSCKSQGMVQAWAT
eukprot:347918-Chlamydomonas_euryale.AAC.4